MNFIRAKRGPITFYIVFGLIPALLWLYVVWPDLTDFTPLIVINLLARILGVVGVCFYAGNLLLSGRYRILDKLFHGLDKLYTFHYQNGKRALYLLLGHGLLIIFGYWYYIKDIGPVIQFIFDYSNRALVFGKIALTGMVVIIVITIFFSKKFKYESLKLIHMFLGLFFFLGGVHAFLIPSDIARNQVLRWYVLSIIFLAVLSWLVRTVFRKVWAHNVVAEVVAVNRLSETVTEVVMNPGKNPPGFLPGQFMFVRFKQPGFPREDHPYTISASATEGKFRLSAKNIGDFSAQLPQLKPGATAYIQGPFGSFTYSKSLHKKQIWIAGGIGITPFISMARTLYSHKNTEGTQYSIDLFYSVQTEADFIFASEFEMIERELPHFKFHTWLTPHDGFISAEKIKEHVALENTDIYICGPAPMMDALISQFKQQGISPDCIHSELFRLL